MYPAGFDLLSSVAASLSLQGAFSEAEYQFK